jgi:hypothetical protein
VKSVDEKAEEQAGQMVQVTADGVVVENAGRRQGMIPLVDDHREHHVEVTVGCNL